MLLNNSRYQTIGTLIGGQHVLTNKFKIKEEEWFGVTRISDTTGYPQGYGAKSFAMPLQSGAISLRDDIKVTTSASGAMGVNAEATTDIGVLFANADAQLIVSGYGSATFSTTSNGSIVASLNGKGNSSFTVNMNHLAMYVNAYGFAGANLDIVTNSGGVMSAIAVCSGSTVDTTGLTPASIWAYQDRTLTAIDVEVSGLTAEQAEQLSKAATKGDVWAARFT